MQIISYLIPGILLSLVDYFLFENNKKPLAIIKKLLFFIISFNIISLNLVKYVFNQAQILEGVLYTTTAFPYKYMAFTLFLGVCFIFAKGVLNSNVSFSKITNKMSKKVLVVSIISVVFFVIGVTFVFFSRWFVNFFGEITPEQFLFNLKSPLKGTASGMSQEILSNPIFKTVTLTTIFLIVLNFNYDIFVVKNHVKIKILSQRYLKLASIVLSFIVLIGGVSYGFGKLRLKEVFSAYLSNSTFIADNYVDPNKTKISFPNKKRNLIHIYLESVENSYLSKDLGGNMAVNLMPELYELSKEGVSFSNNDKLGGPYQTYGSSWSVASMINMGMGIPLKIPMDGNSYGTSGSFLPGAISIGDMLESQGYNQTIMFGADADFGGLTTYFKTHGNFNIFDYKAAKKKKLIPQDYAVWWGFEDDKLYDFAKDELTRLSKEGKPFNFTMETADTHFPDGYLSPNAEKKHDSQYANVISYSTKETVEFVRWIQQQPFYENTTIVLTGDHLSMDKNFFKDFDPSYKRNIFNLILNSPVQTKNSKNREFAPFDMFPTILASMDIEISGDKLGLGTNLFSDKKTLIESKGLKTVESELGNNSNFFNDEFISEKKDSVFSPTK